MCVCVMLSYNLDEALGYGDSELSRERDAMCKGRTKLVTGQCCDELVQSTECLCFPCRCAVELEVGHDALA